MKINSLKKFKTKFDKVRYIDIDELNMTPGQFQPEDTPPDYVLYEICLNIFSEQFKAIEACQNIVDIIKGTRSMTSLQYTSKTVASAMMINALATAYIMALDSCLQHTKLLSYNDSVVMRTLVTSRFGLTNVQLDNIINNREEFEAQVKRAKDLVKSKLVKLGNFEEFMAPYFYEYMYDDQAQYTTKVGYKIELAVLRGTGTDFLTNALKAGFGGTEIGAFCVGATSLSFSDDYNFANCTTTPSDWYNILEAMTTVMFNDTEFHAFRTDYMSAYTEASLWNFGNYTLKEMYSDSDYAINMNAGRLPSIMTHDKTKAVNKRGVLTPYYSYSDIAVTPKVSDFLLSNALVTADGLIDSDGGNIDYIALMNQNNGAELLIYQWTDTGTKYATKANKILNFHKPNVAKPMEVVGVCSTLPNTIAVSKNTSEYVIKIALPAVTYVRAVYLWSTHFKDGVQQFTTAQQAFSLPLAVNATPAYDASQEPYVVSASTDVNGTPGLLRLRVNGTENYWMDRIEEQYDLYEITPSSIADAKRIAQGALLVADIKVANERITNFAELLDLATRS